VLGNKISVIIPTKGRAEQLPGVLRSLLAQSRQIDEMIVVDDSSSTDFDTNEITIRNHLSESAIKVIHVPGRGVGSADARNQGADVSTGDVLSFLDDDVILDGEYYRQVELVFGDANVIGVTGAITNYGEQSSRWTLFAKVFFLSDSSPCGGYLRASGYPCFIFKSGAPRQVQVMSGCNLNFRRKDFMKHRFDELLTGYSYMEDSDLSYRVSRDGILMFEPKCRLRHETADRGVNERFYKVKMSHHRYIFSKNVKPYPWNLCAFALSVLGDLILVAQRSLKEGNKGLVRGALEGLSSGSLPKRS